MAMIGTRSATSRYSARKSGVNGPWLVVTTQTSGNFGAQMGPTSVWSWTMSAQPATCSYAATAWRISVGTPPTPTPGASSYVHAVSTGDVLSPVAYSRTS